MDDIAHLSGALVTTKAYIQRFYPNLPPREKRRLLLFGVVMGVIEDLDGFYKFYDHRKISWENFHRPFTHHRWMTHRPAFYLSLFGIMELIALSFKNKKLERYAEVFIVGSMTHFLMDSVGTDGIAWLYPATKKQYAFAKTEVLGKEYWKNLYKSYPGLLGVSSFAMAVRILKKELKPEGMLLVREAT
jgi:membrane-bound metal-dependent hydrolase YbcI (DUF457 family)